MGRIRALLALGVTMAIPGRPWVPPGAGPDRSGHDPFAAGATDGTVRAFGLL